jgi:hypothetical protein
MILAGHIYDTERQATQGQVVYRVWCVGSSREVLSEMPIQYTS